jgi:hypothetical protein
VTKLPEKLRLKGLAEEGLYFAKRDPELIEALRAKKRLRWLDTRNKKAGSAPQPRGLAARLDRGKRSLRPARCHRDVIQKARQFLAGR